MCPDKGRNALGVHIFTHLKRTIFLNTAISSLCSMLEIDAFLYDF